MSDRPDRGRNFPYEIWLATIHGAPDDVIAELRAEEREELEALARDRDRSIEPESEPASTSWLSSITPTMVARAGRRPAANTVHRAELLHGPSRSTPVDTSGVTDFTERGFKR
jgi:hypothetical protein